MDKLLNSTLTVTNSSSLDVQVQWFPLPILWVYGVLLIVPNSLALISLYKCKRMCLQIKILTINLTVSDLGFGITAIYLGFLHLVPYSCSAQTVQVSVYLKFI